MSKSFGSKLLKNISYFKIIPGKMYFIFVIFIIMSMGDYLFPLLTMYLSQKLLFSADITGLIFTVGSIIRIPAIIGGGYLTDHFGRKKLLIIPQILAFISIFCCFLIKQSLVVPFLLITTMFFISILRPAFHALIVDITNQKNRKASFSLIYLASNLGLASTSMLAGLFFKENEKIIFLWIAISFLVSTVMIALFLQETKPKMKSSGMEDTNPGEESANEFRNEEKEGFLKILLKRPAFLACVLLSIIFFIIIMQFLFSMPIYTEKLFGEIGVKIFGYLMMINALCVIILTPILTTITGNIRSINNIIAGGLLTAFGFGMLHFLNSFELLMLSTVIWTCGEILILTNLFVYIAEYTPISHRGRFNSIIPFISIIGFSVGSYSAGYFIKFFSIRKVWILIFILSTFFSTAILCIDRIEARLKRRVRV